MKLLVLKVSV